MNQLNKSQDHQNRNTVQEPLLNFASNNDI